jgi:formate dehydrogenase maturation protein FdhE
MTMHVLEKQCTKCHAMKPLSDFYVYKTKTRARRVSRCKPCHIAVTGVYQKANRHINRAAGKRWRERNPRGEINHRLKFLYGITLDQYEQMFADQHGLCLICRLPEPSGTRLAVDHCHSTKKVRGLLCKKCNSALYILEREELRKAAEKYLEERS